MMINTPDLETESLLNWTCNCLSDCSLDDEDRLLQVGITVLRRIIYEHTSSLRRTLCSQVRAEGAEDGVRGQDG